MIDYYEYIKSDAWQKRTESVRIRNSGLCECCNMRWGIAVHHRTYERLGNELEDDLIHICDDCHKYIHRLKDDIFIWESKFELIDKLRREADGLKSNKHG